MGFVGNKMWRGEFCADPDLGMRVLSEEKCQQQKSGEEKNFGVEKYDVFL